MISKTYDFYRNYFRDKAIDGVIAPADSGTINNVITPRNVRWTVFIQRILLSVTTDAAQTLTFQDDNGTPKVVAKSPASPGLGIEVVADFGPEGIALTEGTNLDIVISGAGLGCIYSIEAYEKLTGVSTPENA